MRWRIWCQKKVTLITNSWKKKLDKKVIQFKNCFIWWSHEFFFVIFSNFFPFAWLTVLRWRIWCKKKDTLIINSWKKKLDKKVIQFNNCFIWWSHEFFFVIFSTICLVNGLEMKNLTSKESHFNYLFMQIKIRQKSNSVNQLFNMMVRWIFFCDFFKFFSICLVIGLEIKNLTSKESHINYLFMQIKIRQKSNSV